LPLDPEILRDFQRETQRILGELEDVVDSLESGGTDFPEAGLKEFAQKVDRIMGAAKSLLVMDPGRKSLSRIAELAEICKTIGYQATALQRGSLIPLFTAFWADTIETMAALTAKLEDPEAIVDTSVLRKRLEWLAAKVAPPHDVEKHKVSAFLKKL